MSDWHPQQYMSQGKNVGVDQRILTNAFETAAIIRNINPALPPIFSLGHLAFLTGADYNVLRDIASRNNVIPYRIFTIRKKPSPSGELRFRTIAVPRKQLFAVQQWITQAILSKLLPHDASVAFSKGNKLVDAAAPHCNCRWMIKLDVKDFFESITEISAYRVFRAAGYQPLISFEMARLCTRLKVSDYNPVLRPAPRRQTKRWQVANYSTPSVIQDYKFRRMGHLPQGAPTSPMLANLAVREFDSAIAKLAAQNGMIYTRYADDMVLSTNDSEFDRARCVSIIGKVYRQMGQFGLTPNLTKARIASPGSRKVVLGLLVNGAKPALSREFKDRIRQHIYYLTNPDFGPAKHATNRGFVSILGLKHHIQGLLAFANQIDPTFAKTCKDRLAAVDWPF